MTTPHRAVSLFSNCGAGDLGYRRAGFGFDVMAEIEGRRLAIALANHPGAVGVEGDLRETWKRVIEEYRRRGRSRPDLLCACPPCQGLSSAQSERGDAADADAGSRDPRNLLVTPIIEVARALRPRVIVVENVLAFLSRKVRHPRTRASVSAAHVLVSELAADYRAFPLLTDLADYGVPQTRRRAFLTFIARDAGLLAVMRRHGRTPYPRPTHVGERDGHVTLRKALTAFDLGSLDARTADGAAGDGRLHQVPVWDRRRYSMVNAIPPDSGASAWENDRCPTCRRLERRRERATCGSCGATLRRPVIVGRNGRPRLIRGFRASSYRRMHPDRPAATITTASAHLGSDITLHPSENRVLSIRECAMLQTLPRSFTWLDSLDAWGPTSIRAMIGEAVPPRFTELHGRRLVALLERREWRALLQADDARASRASLHLEKGASST